MQRNFREAFWDWMLIVLGAALLLTALLVPFRIAISETLTPEEARLMEAFQSGELIRLHIVANSDSAEDQAVKLNVRDAIISAFGPMITENGHNGSDALFSRLKQNVSLMQQAALNCAREHGFEGCVSAEAGILSLPEKSYGSVTLPAGRYRALRIVLGKGEGQNWWCVLFPQLCLALSETDASSGNELGWASERILQRWLLTSV